METPAAAITNDGGIIPLGLLCGIIGAGIYGILWLALQGALSIALSQ